MGDQIIDFHQCFLFIFSPKIRVAVRKNITNFHSNSQNNQRHIEKMKQLS